MQVKINIGKISETNTLKTIETITHLRISKDEFKNYFAFFKDNLLLKANSFENRVWSMPHENKDRDIIFNFDIEVYQELNEALKGYILLKRMTGTTIGSCHTILNTLKKIIFETNGLKDLESLEAALILKTPMVAYETALTIKRFLLFYEHPLKDEIIVKCNQIKRPERQNRNLPHFTDVLVFNEHIERFFVRTNKLNVNYIRFYPIFIWWKLTNVIPMRVGEFLNLKLNCLEKKEDGTYWITLPREKKKSDSPFKIEVTDTLQINKEMYNLILDYIQFIKDNEIETEYLLPYDLYVKYLPYPKKSSRQRKGNRNRLIDKYLQRIIDDFYIHCIKDNTLERVRCGDTRHFAIINMFMQGFNMLSIARMAGHDELETQFNYFSHMDHFVESQVFVLAQKKLEQRIELTVGSRLNNNLRYFYDKGLIYNETDIALNLQVEYGYCTNENFPDNCAGECRVCTPFYIFKPAINELEEGIKWLTDCSNAIQRNIKEVTDMMIALNMNMFYDLENLKQQESGQAKLNSASSQLVRLMDQKSTVEAWLRRYKHE